MMPTCREVARVIAAGEVERLPLSRRWLVTLHVSMCGHCARFVRELRRMGEAARSLWNVRNEDREVVDRLERFLSAHIGDMQDDGGRMDGPDTGH